MRLVKGPLILGNPEIKVCGKKKKKKKIFRE